MRKIHAAGAFALIAALTACSSNTAKAKADSVAAADSAAVQDSIRAAVQHVNDSLAAAAGNAAIVAAPTTSSPNGTTGETHKSNDPATSGNVIGRDSAHGPIGTMDANGKITKIKR
ncbi:MAG: hypothetical protein ACRD3J_05620 [Thermoanaerobaculia bacterium]